MVGDKGVKGSRCGTGKGGKGYECLGVLGEGLRFNLSML